jgi:hypothetical protein
MHTIELDCAPCGPRPFNLLPGVIAGLGLKLDPEKPNGTFFGNWTWTIPEDQAAHYETVRDQVEERIKKLYHDGYIRYGSW